MRKRPLPDCFGNHGKDIVRLGKVVKWLRKQAEVTGVEACPGLAGAAISRGMLGFAPARQEDHIPMERLIDYRRGDARRLQILAAAARCFCEHGFHGASISQISKGAGMSPGHIYHYFDNKDAIIEAIVARDLEHRLALTEILRELANSRSALRALVAQAITKQLDPDAAALKIEIVAEAGRNPKVAQIVRDADAVARKGLTAAIREIRSRSGFVDDELIIDGIVELLSALFGGVLIRGITNPALDAEALTSSFVRIIEAALYANEA